MYRVASQACGHFLRIFLKLFFCFQAPPSNWEDPSSSVPEPPYIPEDPPFAGPGRAFTAFVPPESKEDAFKEEPFTPPLEEGGAPERAGKSSVAILKFPLFPEIVASLYMLFEADLDDAPPP